MKKPKPMHPKTSPRKRSEALMVSCGCRWSDQRNAASVFREPRLEVEQIRVQRARSLQAARRDELLLELGVVLEHVAQVVRARKSEAAKHRGTHSVVHNLFAERFGHVSRHLGAGHMVSRDADALADPLLALFEDAVGAFADVLGGDAR